MSTADAVIARIPAFCWLIVCLCLVAYTLTFCVVMLRSSAINVTVSGMTMAMTKAADVQNAAASDLDNAAQTIAKLEAVIKDLQAKKAWTAPTMGPPSPSPMVELPPLVQESAKLRVKADGVRESAKQLQQQIQQSDSKQ